MILAPWQRYALVGAPVSIASLLGANGIHFDFTDALLREYNTQPAPTGWAGASWAGAALGPYTHTAGDTTALAHAALLVVGNRHTTIFTVSGRTAGTVTYYAGTTAGAARSTNATFTEDLTCAGNTTHSFVPSADFDGAVTVTSVVNWSVKTATPKTARGTLAGSTLTQATATAMGYAGASGVVFATDNYASSLAASAWPLHKAAGCSIFRVIKITSAATVHLGGTAVLTTDHGVFLIPTYGASYTLTARVVNGAGYAVNNVSTATWAAGALALVEFHHDATGYTIGVNGALNSGALTDVHSTADATYTYRTMGRSDTGAFGPADAEERDEVIAIGRLSASAATGIRRILAAKNGITLA